MDDDELFDRLQKLLPQQMDSVIGHAGLVVAHLTRGAPTATVALEILTLARQDPETRARIERVLRAVQNPPGPTPQTKITHHTTTPEFATGVNPAGANGYDAESDKSSPYHNQSESIQSEVSLNYVYLKLVQVDFDGLYPWNMPLKLNVSKSKTRVFILGENGSGKSSLLEYLALVGHLPVLTYAPNCNKPRKIAVQFELKTSTQLTYAMNGPLATVLKKLFVNNIGLADFKTVTVELCGSDSQDLREDLAKETKMAEHWTIRNVSITPKAPNDVTTSELVVALKALIAWSRPTESQDATFERLFNQLTPGDALTLPNPVPDSVSDTVELHYHYPSPLQQQHVLRTARPDSWVAPFIAYFNTDMYDFGVGLDIRESPKNLHTDLWKTLARLGLLDPAYQGRLTWSDDVNKVWNTLSKGVHPQIDPPQVTFERDGQSEIKLRQQRSGDGKFFSSGENQRIFLSLMFGLIAKHGNGLLLLDEPELHLDRVSKKNLHKYLLNDTTSGDRQAGLGKKIQILVATHESEFVRCAVPRGDKGEVPASLVYMPVINNPATKGLYEPETENLALDRWRAHTTRREETTLWQLPRWPPMPGFSATIKMAVPCFKTLLTKRTAGQHLWFWYGPSGIFAAAIATVWANWKTAPDDVSGVTGWAPLIFLAVIFASGAIRAYRGLLRRAHEEPAFIGLELGTFAWSMTLGMVGGHPGASVPVLQKWFSATDEVLSMAAMFIAGALIFLVQAIRDGVHLSYINKLVDEQPKSGSKKTDSKSQTTDVPTISKPVFIFEYWFNLGSFALSVVAVLIVAVFPGTKGALWLAVGAFGFVTLCILAYNLHKLSKLWKSGRTTLTDSTTGL
ncbi:MAG: ATP-binding protein [Myxococcales bacterium]|nr:ATP-binding protein [Myxococcales bacterium]